MVVPPSPCVTERKYRRLQRLAPEFGPRVVSSVVLSLQQKIVCSLTATPFVTPVVVVFPVPAANLIVTQDVATVDCCLLNVQRQIFHASSGRNYVQQYTIKRKIDCCLFNVQRQILHTSSGRDYVQQYIIKRKKDSKKKTKE